MGAAATCSVQTLSKVKTTNRLFPQIVSEERSGGSTNVRTAYPGWDRGGGGGTGSSPKGMMGGTPKGKYNWHTVVDGLSK